MRCPCSEVRGELAANGHRELLDHEERQAGDDAGGDSDGGVAASGRRRERDRDQHDDEARQRLGQAGLVLGVEDRFFLRLDVWVDATVAVDFGQRHAPAFVRPSVEQRRDFQFALDLHRCLVELLQPQRLLKGDGVRLGKAFRRLVVSHLMERPASAFPCALHGHDFALWLVVVPFPRDDDGVLANAAHLAGRRIERRYLPTAAGFVVAEFDVGNPLGAKRVFFAFRLDGFDDFPLAQAVWQPVFVRPIQSRREQHSNEQVRCAHAEHADAGVADGDEFVMPRMLVDGVHEREQQRHRHDDEEIPRQRHPVVPRDLSRANPGELIQLVDQFERYPQQHEPGQADAKRDEPFANQVAIKQTHERRSVSTAQAQGKRRAWPSAQKKPGTRALRLVG